LRLRLLVLFSCLFLTIGGTLATAQTRPVSIVGQPNRLPSRFLETLRGSSSPPKGARTQNTALVNFGSSGLNFSPVVDYSSGGTGVESLIAADLNGDGKLDLVILNETTSTLGVLLGNGDGTFQPAVTYAPVSGNLAMEMVADVNGDGKPDLLVTGNCLGSDCGDGEVSVLLGNGDGTFRPAVTYDSGGTTAYVLSVADVNRDGKPDLLVTNLCATGNTECGFGPPDPVSYVSVLLGNGDGTFRTAVSYTTGGFEPTSLAVADLNSDGNPDLVITNWCPDGSALACQSGSYSAVSVLLGNGDGTFQPAVAYNPGGWNTFAVTAVDLNADGKLDLVVANSAGYYPLPNGTVGVLLGDGDGTFQPVMQYSLVQNVSYAALADMDGDGYPDLAVANDFDVVSVMLGNGDGTFKPAVNYNSGGNGPDSITLADVDGDGKMDLLVANTCGCETDGSVGVLLGNGDGTFQPAITYDSGGGRPLSLTVVDINGDGKPDALTPNFGLISTNEGGNVGVLINRSNSTTSTALHSSANPVYVNQSVTYKAAVTNLTGTTATGTIAFADGKTTVATVNLSGNQASYTTSYPKTGLHSITATYSGDSKNIGSSSPALLEMISAAGVTTPTTTTVTSSGSPSFVGQPVTFTASVSWKHGAVPNGELVTFYDGTTSLGTGVTSNSSATFTTSSLSVAAHTIRAAYSGDRTFKPSSGTVSQLITLYSTTTALSASPNPSAFGQNVGLTATVSSGASSAPTGVVTFKSRSAILGTATVTAGVALLATSKLPLGSDSLTATYNGDTVNGTSTSTAYVQTVNQATISITLTSSPNPSTVGQAVRLMATLKSNGGLPVGTGNIVTFTLSGATLGTATIMSNGGAMFSTTTLPQGSNLITASYSGSADYSSATAMHIQTVN
jgi:hypothetical protein